MVVIGAGRVGTALRLRAERAGRPLRLLDRTGSWAPLEEPIGEPILLAVRNDDLDTVIGRVPLHRHRDLVFLQNGAIRELLSRHGLALATRGLLYVMVARRGDEGLSGAPSVFTGLHAETVAKALFGMGLDAEAVDRERFGEVELEKLLWLAILGPLCDKTGQPVDVVAEEHQDEMARLVAELAPVGRAAWGVAAREDELLERIVAYSKAIAGYRASVKEWPWRNGWLVAQARAHGLPTPAHDALLTELGHLE